MKNKEEIISDCNISKIEFKRLLKENKITPTKLKYKYNGYKMIEIQLFDPSIINTINSNISNWRSEFANSKLSRFSINKIKIELSKQLKELNIQGTVSCKNNQFLYSSAINKILKINSSIIANIQFNITSIIKSPISDEIKNIENNLSSFIENLNVKLSSLNYPPTTLNKFILNLNKKLHNKIVNYSLQDSVNFVNNIVSSEINFFEKLQKDTQLYEESGLDNYPNLFPLARSIKRKFKLFVGPTNSGKTFEALNILKSSNSGVYAAPLRLMALEIFDTLQEEYNIPCSMITGEEHIHSNNSNHTSCTIEMIDFTKQIDSAVIDEVQMLNDPNRGWAWTAALIGLPAKEIIMTGSPDSIPFVQNITNMLEEELEIKFFERKTPLSPLKDPVNINHLKKGDAIIAFSRKDVLILKQILSNKYSTAVIYGNLGPEVRKIEAKRFREGKADILIATDAIGMGLNLPCQRILLSNHSKFDGNQNRELKISELKQIVGRAGRFNIYNEGFAGAFENKNTCQFVKSTLSKSTPIENDLRPFVMPPWNVINLLSSYLSSQNLEYIIKYFTFNILNEKKLRAPNIEQTCQLSKLLDSTSLPLYTKFKYLGTPFDNKITLLNESLSSWSKLHASNKQIPSPTLPFQNIPETDQELLNVEEYVKNISMYLWLALRWKNYFIDYQQASSNRCQANSLIEKALQKKFLHRTCRDCGSKLKPNHNYAICQNCYERHYSYFDND